MEWLVAVAFFVTIIACAGMLLGFIDGRRKFKLAQQKEQRRLVEARTQELEAQNRQRELDYQRAHQELERFDRRSAGLPGPVPSTGAAELSDPPAG